MSQCEQLAKSQTGKAFGSICKKSRKKTLMWNAFFEANLFDNEQAKIYTPPLPH